MRYKLTLLKDLPNYPAGTLFAYHKGNVMNLGNFKEEEFMGLYGNDTLSYPLCISKKLIDDPAWIKKEIDIDNLLDLRCPICGETRGEMSVRSYRYGNSDDGYGNSADVFFEYVCGHEKRKLW